MLHRRDLLKLGALGSLSLGTSLLSGCRHGSPPSSQDKRSEQEELIALLEGTDREHLLERIAPRIASGLEWTALMAALFAAGVRNVVPRQEFSKAHHILLCVYSIHLAGQQLSPDIPWRPMLWAVDYFKWAQAEVKESDPEPMGELAPSRLPPAKDAERAFQAAMEDFDGPRAEAAMAALWRAGLRDELVENLLRYGSKDFRHIGHKAIYVANALRTLGLVGWARAEPVLRSIAMTLTLHYQQAGRDFDGAWRQNQQALSRITPEWQRGRESPEAVVQLLSTFRQASPQDASSEVLESLNRGVSPQSVWDAMFLSGAELMFNNPTAIEALHAVTASNAAYTAFEATRDDATRLLLLLQNAGRVADFHQYTAYGAVKRNRPAMFSLELAELEPVTLEASSSHGALDEIFAEVGLEPSARLRAAQKTLAYLSADPANVRPFGRRAVELATSRADDTHDFKLPAAALEDSWRLSPAWRPRYLAACTARFRGAGEPRTELSERIDELARHFPR